MRTRWQSSGASRGRLLLGSAGALVVNATGGDVSFARGALTLSGALPPTGEGDGMLLTVVHPFRRCDHVWVPHLTPEDGNVIGDFVFRSPALVVATPTCALALVPDLDDVAAADGWRAWLDYDHPRRRATLAAGAYRAEGHVFFVKEPISCRGQRVRLTLHVLASDRRSDCANPYGMVARWMWGRWGRPRFETGGSQRAPLARYMDHVARWAFSEKGWGKIVWQSLDLGGVGIGAPVFIVDVAQHPSIPAEERRWREPRSIWNQTWFSTQRCANGLYRYAQQIGSDDLAARARAMTAVALAAPQHAGLFPAVLRGDDAGWQRARWTNSDRRPASASERACHVVDAAFTCRMLLEWHDLTAEPRVVPYVRRFAERLVALQRPTGAFPGWVEPDGSVVPELAESAETAVGVSLLFDLAARGDLPRAWRDAALAGVAFVERIAATGRWEDFEAYYSCAPWGRERIGQRVGRNGVYKQNTLAIAWCAEALLQASRATRRRELLHLARRCLDELSLYQAVCDPPFLPAPAHGGFGVMNADSEWNDARQSLFALLYLEAYVRTGALELFERAISAVRASFAMVYCPENDAIRRAYERRFPFFGPESYGFTMENQGHGGGEPVGTFTIYSWGNGSALATAATVLDRFGDVFVDTRRRRALPIDGVAAEVRGARVLIEDRYGRTHVRAVYADGRRASVRLRSGRAIIPL